MKAEIKPYITVVIYTYNQSELVSRNIESVLNQKDFILEIIISDDCSTDTTWDVIVNYQKRYPKLIKAYRNDQNLGIFEHLESTWSKVNGDLIFYMAGDDEFCPGVFEKATKLVIRNNIDPKKDSFSLYFDFKFKTADGKERVFRNRKLKKHNPISLKIRNLIFNRTVGFSRNVLKEFYPVNKSIGIFADGLLDIQVQLFSQKNYYDPFVGSIYYTGLGISSKTKKLDSLRSYRKYFEEVSKVIDTKLDNNENWLEYMKRKISYSISPVPKNYFYYVVFFVRGNSLAFGIRFFAKEFKELVINTFLLKIK